MNQDKPRWAIFLAASALTIATLLILGWLAFQAIALPFRIAYQFGSIDASMRCVRIGVDAAKENLAELKSTSN